MQGKGTQRNAKQAQQTFAKQAKQIKAKQIYAK